MPGRNNQREGRKRGVRTVTRQREAQARRAGDDPYRLLFERNPCPMWICDKKTVRFLDVNEAALQLYGWSDKAFLLMTAKDIRPPEDVAKFLRVVGRQRKLPVTFVGEWRHLKRDSTMFDVEVTISSIPYA